DYAYAHDAPDGFPGDDYWPAEMAPQTFYPPAPRGFEAKIAERLAYWDGLRAERRGGG
ncbi:replication-associated recombination protein A, partial [Sphingomonas solaris]